MTIFIELEQGLAVVARLGLYVRDNGLFFSALARPAASAFGRDAYDDLELKAAALLNSLTRNHGLMDGNKRTAWILTIAFLNLNRVDIDMTQNEKFDLVLGVAQGKLELEETARILGLHLVPESLGAVS